MSGTDKPKRPADHSNTIKTISDLKADSTNARKHGERNIAMLERSLEQYGAARSIVVDEKNMILCGYGVVEAAASGLSKKQKAELAIADNRTQELSEWDAAALKESDADLEQFFTKGEFEALEDHAAKVKELEIKPPPTMVWVLLRIPLDLFGKVQKHLKALEARADIVVKATRDDEER